MQIYLEEEKEVTFVCPDGCYLGTLASVKPCTEFKAGISKQFLKFIFDLQVNSLPDKIVKVVKKIPIKAGSTAKLREFLIKWIGKEDYKKLGSSFDPEQLIGRTADVVVHQEFNEGYEDPLTVIDAIVPAGSTKERIVFKQKGDGI